MVSTMATMVELRLHRLSSSGRLQRTTRLHTRQLHRGALGARGVVGGVVEGLIVHTDLCLLKDCPLFMLCIIPQDIGVVGRTYPVGAFLGFHLGYSFYKADFSVPVRSTINSSAVI